MPRSRRPAFGLKILILLVWAGLMAVLVHRVYIEPESLVPVATDLAESEEWTAIHLKGQKVGYSVQTIKKTETGYHLDQKTFLRMNLGQVMDLWTRTSARLGPGLDMESFDFQLAAGPVEYRLAGMLDGLDLRLVSRTGGQETRQVLRLDQPPRLAAGLLPYLSREGLTPGKAFMVPLFDPSTLSTKPVRVVVEEPEKLMVDGEAKDTVRLRMDFYDTKTFAWIDGQGRVVKEEGLLGLSMIRTTEAKAREGLVGVEQVPDLLAATSAPASRVLPNPRKTKFLRVRLTGLDLGGLDLDGGRQKQNGDVVEITREDPAAWGDREIPIRDADLKPYLASSLTINSQDAQIIEQAGKIRGTDFRVRPVSEKITGWVYRTLEKRPTLSVPTAVGVLKTQVGDCNEHAILAAALLRSQGIPARVAVGVLYFQDRFYYHAWLEVHGGTWLALDPTLGQTPADATHIRFLTGDLDRQSELVRVIGRLRVEILDWAEDDRD